MDYLDQLNPAQRKAVEHLDGPSMVIAGAGSGKTRLLTFRIAHLLNSGVDAFNILALTFTNKAAREMKGRIGKIVGDTEAQNLWMGTFHSNFARILRYEHDKLGYPSNFTIYDTQDAKNLIKSIIKEKGLDDKVYKPNVIYNRISSAKNNLITPEAYNADVVIQSDDRQAQRPMTGAVYSTYALRLFQAAAMDFDDLLFKTHDLLDTNAEALFKYQNKFKYILVDEFQDTNRCQYLILKKLAARHENVCVVGDDAQSIYAFRGANIENMLNFQKDYSDTRVFKLEQNYRSTKTIVNAANSIISKNKQQLHKQVWTDNQEGAKIKVLRALTDNEEGHTVANQIFEIKNNQQSRNLDFAILYRTNAQSRAMEEALRRQNIPYRVYGGLSFYQRREVKDLLAYFRVTINPKDEEALKRIINYPARGIGKTTMEKIIVKADETNSSLWAVINQPDDCHLDINAGTKSRLGEFVTMIKSFRTLLKDQAAYDAGSHIAKASGIINELYNDQTPEGLSRYDNLQELLNALKEFTDQPLQEGKQYRLLEEFMQNIALLTDMDTGNPDDHDRVSLMTIHSAKGLEFPYVFITGVEENLFPSQFSLSSRAELEEERRLFYVALTRAEKRATLSYALSRYRWGNLMDCEPSRFLEEIDAKYLDYGTAGNMFAMKRVLKKREVVVNKSITSARVNHNLVKMEQVTGKIEAFHPDDTLDLQVGMEVVHQRFGKGKVLNLDGDLHNRKATVFFPAFGQKLLLLKFAKLQIMN